jgi:plasmid stabilization system protein ParE
VIAQPSQPATDRGESPATDPDIIVVPEDAAEGDAAEADVVEADSGADDGVTNNGVNSVATNGSEDDLADASVEQDNLSNDYPATTEPSPTRDSTSIDDPAATQPSLVPAAAEAGTPGGIDGDSVSPAPMTAGPMTAGPTTSGPMTSGPMTSNPTAADSQAADLGQQWHDIQAMFVDDPRGSVERAAAAAEAAVSGLAEALRRQAALPEAGADTEQLRGALRSYRIFCQSLADIGRQLPHPQAVGR